MDELATYIQRDAQQARKTLEMLNEAGLVQAHGVNRHRTYTLSLGIYQAAGDRSEYTRQVGFSPLQHEQLVLNYAAQHGQIKRAEVMELCRLTKDQAFYLLKKLRKRGDLIQHDSQSASFYKLPERQD